MYIKQNSANRRNLADPKNSELCRQQANKYKFVEGDKFTI